MYLLDRFSSVTPGEPYRLFPFGKIFKDGRERNLTPELASTIKLPHFKPPIKLGSHQEATPAGGFIIGLEVRADGLYAIPEFNDNGTAVIAAGAYRYHSPEIIWEGGFENPETGELIAAPLIVGDAFLHTPHLGEGAALYEVTIIGEDTMTAETVNIPVSFFDRLLGRQQEPQTTPEPQKQPVTAVTDNYAAQVAEYKAQAEAAQAKVAEYEAMQAKAGRVAQYAAAFKDSAAVKEDVELHQLLAGVDPETADKLVIKFRALSAQIDETALTGNVGNGGGQTQGDPVQRLQSEIAKYMADHKASYNTAVTALAHSKPELFEGVK